MFPYPEMYLTPYKPMIGTKAVLQHEGDSGGVALTAVRLQAVFLWMPERKLYGIFLLAMKDRPFD